MLVNSSSNLQLVKHIIRFDLERPGQIAPLPISLKNLSVTEGSDAEPMWIVQDVVQDVIEVSANVKRLDLQSIAVIVLHGDAERNPPSPGIDPDALIFSQCTKLRKFRINEKSSRVYHINLISTIAPKKIGKIILNHPVTSFMPPYG